MREHKTDVYLCYLKFLWQPRFKNFICIFLRKGTVPSNERGFLKFFTIISAWVALQCQVILSNFHCFVLWYVDLELRVTKTKRSEEGLTLETSALKLFSVAHYLHYQLG